MELHINQFLIHTVWCDPGTLCVLYRGVRTTLIFVNNLSSTKTEFVGEWMLCKSSNSLLCWNIHDNVFMGIRIYEVFNVSWTWLHISWMKNLVVIYFTKFNSCQCNEECKLKQGHMSVMVEKNFTCFNSSVTFSLLFSKIMVVLFVYDLETPIKFFNMVICSTDCIDRVFCIATFVNSAFHFPLLTYAEAEEAPSFRGGLGV